MRTKELKTSLSLILLFIILTTSVSAAPGVSASSAVLYDPVMDRTLFDKNPDRKMLIASTTKIMTAVVVIENANLDELVLIGKEPTLVEGSSMYLRQGEKISVRSLLEGLLLVSGNDAATALAIHVCGTTADFARLMNKTAKRLGLANTSFANPHGLDHENHYSTARDMSRLASYAMSIPEFEAIVSSKDIKTSGRSLHNHNKLLWQVDGADGVKTGYTKAAGRCLVSSASRNGQRLIAVTLDAPNDWADHSGLFEYGFGKYPSRKVTPEGAFTTVNVKGGIADEAPVCAGDDVVLSLTDEEYSRLKSEVMLPGSITAPAGVGDVIGVITFTLDGKVVATSGLRLMENVMQPSEDKSAKTDISPSGGNRSQESGDRQ